MRVPMSTKKSYHSTKALWLVTRCSVQGDEVPLTLAVNPKLRAEKGKGKLSRCQKLLFLKSCTDSFRFRLECLICSMYMMLRPLLYRCLGVSVGLNVNMLRSERDTKHSELIKTLLECNADPLAANKVLD